MSLIKNDILLVVAGGSGARFGAEIPKQFLNVLDGKNPLDLALERANKLGIFQKILVALPAEYLGKYEDSEHIKFFVGGASRRSSVKNLLNKLDDTDGRVWIHDAVRPLFESDIEKLLGSVDRVREGAAISLGARVVDTLARVDEENRLLARVPRDGMVRLFTPQIFMISDLLDIISKDEIVSTDEATSFMEMGGEVLLIEGIAANVKITYPEVLRVWLSWK